MKVSNDDEGSDGAFIEVTGSCLVTVNGWRFTLHAAIFSLSQIK